MLPRLTDGHYDLVFCDGDKTEYAEYLAEAMRLLKPGGIVAFDNALWHDRVADPAQRDAETVAIRELGTHRPRARLAAAGAAPRRRRPPGRQEGLDPRRLTLALRVTLTRALVHVDPGLASTSTRALRDVDDRALARRRPSSRTQTRLNVN